DEGQALPGHGVGLVHHGEDEARRSHVEENDRADDPGSHRLEPPHGTRCKRRSRTRPSPRLIPLICPVFGSRRNSTRGSCAFVKASLYDGVSVKRASGRRRATRAPFSARIVYVTSASSLT